MPIREEIEQSLEAALASEIKNRVEEYQGEIEMKTAKLGGLHSPQKIKQLLKTKTEQVKKELMRPQDRDRIERGFQIILNRLDNLPNRKLIQQELEKAQTKFDPNHMSEDVELQEQLGLSNDAYNAFYSISLNEMHEGGVAGDLEKPLCVFLYLTQLNRRFFEPHLFLGICYQANKEYHSALNAYWNASTLAPSKLEPFLRSAECYLAIGEKDKAKEVLEIAEKMLVQNQDTANRDWIDKLKIDIKV